MEDNLLLRCCDALKKAAAELLAHCQDYDHRTATEFIGSLTTLAKECAERAGAEIVDGKLFVRM